MCNTLTAERLLSAEDTFVVLCAYKLSHILTYSLIYTPVFSFGQY